jgi:hypothetical protein
MTFSIIRMAEGVLLIDISCAIQVVIILLILFSHVFTFPGMSPLFTCLEYYKLCVPLQHCLNARAESDFYVSSFNESLM